MTISLAPIYERMITQAAADRSRPGIVSSLAAVLEVLCAFTATEGHPCESHAKVVHDAFFCLTGLAEAVPESSAGAECVKAALVALKGCAEVCRQLKSKPKKFKY